MLVLDFTLNSAIERKQLVDNFIKENPTYHFTNREIETISNYLLYGKDESGLSVVDKKLVQIETRYSSYKKKEPHSLDELSDNPAFSEASIPQNPLRTKTIKYKIDRTVDFDIPGIQQLWTEIDRLAHIIKVSEGKEEDFSIEPLDSRSLYYAKHQLIELRREQYFLKDMYKPTVAFNAGANRGDFRVIDPSIPWDQPGSNYSIAPLGIKSVCPIRFTNPRSLSEKDYHYNSQAKYILDFRNKEHIYCLIEAWTELETLAEVDKESTAEGILETLKFYIEKADLSEKRKLILERKIDKVSNKEIGDELVEKFGVSYGLNYISTIYKQKVCEEIAKAAILHYDEYMERENTYAWKTCVSCKRVLLRDTRDFMRKTKSSDGLSNKCKKCAKEERSQ